MYIYLLWLHSVTRWLLVIALTATLYRSFRGWFVRAAFTAPDNTLRHVTATIAHVQLALGYVLYFKSPVVMWFRQHQTDASTYSEYTFFGIVHIALMTIAVIVVTIGSSAAKRQNNDQAKFKMLALCFAVATVIIFLAIPWPFSPWITRPWLRTL